MVSKHPGKQGLAELRKLLLNKKFYVMFGEWKWSNMLCNGAPFLLHLENGNDTRIPRAIRRPQNARMIEDVLLSLIYKVEETTDAFLKCLQKKLDSRLRFSYLH